MDRPPGGLEYLVSDLPAEDVYAPEDLSDDERQIAATAARFAADAVVPHLERLEHQDFELTTRLLRQAGELGLLMIDIPEEDGGLGLGKATSALAGEHLAPAGSFALTLMCHAGIGTLPLVYYGTAAQKARYLPRLASGELPAAYCLTEPGSGSDALGARTTARLASDGTHFVLEGTKQFITNSAFAGLFTVFAKVEGKHFTAFLIERGTPGLTVGPEERKLGLKGSSTAQVILDQVAVPVENVLGEVGKGHKIAFNVLNVGRFKLGAAAIGTAKAALADASRYALERRQFGRPIASFGAVGEKVADMATDLFAAESMLYRVAGLLDRRIAGVPRDAERYYEAVQASIETYAAECAAVKVYCTEALALVAEEGLQIHGGYGFIQEYSAERVYRDERANRIFEGTNEINRILVATTLLRRVTKGELRLERTEPRLVTPGAGAREAPAAFAAEERALLARCKAVLVDEASSLARLGDRIRHEQEILLACGDFAIQLLAFESALLRGERAARGAGVEVQARLQDVLRVAAFRAAEEMGRAGRRLASFAAGREDRGARLEAVQRATLFGAEGLLAAKRRLSAATCDAGRYPF